MFDALTRGIHIKVEPEYLAEESSPENGVYIFAYHITIKNKSDLTVQLVSRYWRITNSHGEQQEVSGPGVVGQQPILKPGQSHRYSSFCPLKTPVGTMEGSYQMVTEKNEAFDAVIPLFTLAAPNSMH